MSYNADLDRSLQAINTTYKVLEQDLFGGQLPGTYEMFTDVVPTNAENTEIDWVGETPMMKKWVGARIYEEMRAYLHSIKLAKYATAMPIRRMSLQYGQSQAIQKRLAMYLKEQAQVYQQEAIAKLIENPTGYDGVSVFSASHPFAYGGTASNYTTNALTRENYNTARTAMQVYQTERGRRWAIIPDTILIGPALEKVAKEIFTVQDRKVIMDDAGSEATQFGISGTSIGNIWYGELKVVVDPNLTGSTSQYYWFLLDTSKPSIKPVICVEGRKPEAINRTDMDDPHRFEYDEFLYGVEGDFAFGAGFWQTAYGAFSTTAPS